FRDLTQPGLKQALRKVGGIYVPPTAHTPPRLAGDAVALFDIVTSMHGLESFAVESARSLPVRLGGVIVRVLPLVRIIASKRALNRPKDRGTLAVLEDAARAARAHRGRKTAPAKQRH